MGTPIEASKRFLKEHYPECTAALLGGSAANGQLNHKSDLDLVIIDPDADICFQEVVAYEGWTIDTFVFYEDVILDFFALNADKGIPTLQKLCAEGVVLCNVEGAADRLKEEARQSLKRGPTAWTLDEMNEARYHLTDMLLDLEAASEWIEVWMIGSRLVWQTSEFALRAAERWCGEGKWQLRELKACSPTEYGQLTLALEAFEASRQQQPFIDWVDRILEPYGGRLFSGYYAEGDPNYSS